MENLNCFIGRRMGGRSFPSQEFHFHVQHIPKLENFANEDDAFFVLLEIKGVCTNASINWQSRLIFCNSRQLSGNNKALNYRPLESQGIT